MPEFPTSEESKPPLCPPDGGAALALAVSIAAAAAWQPQLVQVVVLDGRVRRRRRHDVDVAPDGEAIVLYVPRPLQGIPPDETREARTEECIACPNSAAALSLYGRGRGRHRRHHGPSPP